jgi:hypothetical protein
MEFMHSPQPYMRYKEGTDKINGSRFARRIFPMTARGVAIAARDVALVSREIVGGRARGVATAARDVTIVARGIARGGTRGPARGVAIAARDVATQRPGV